MENGPIKILSGERQKAIKKSPKARAKRAPEKGAWLMSELRRVSELYKKAVSLGRGDSLYGRWLDALLSSTAAEFKEAGIKVKFYSRLVGETVYLVSDEESKWELESEGVDPGCIYTADELALLAGIVNSPEDLKRVHEDKKRFGGMLVPTPPGVFDDEGFDGDVGTEVSGLSNGMDAGDFDIDSMIFPVEKMPADKVTDLRISLGKLASRIAQCKRCPLHAGRNRIVSGEGYPGSIMVVGEAPGRQEDATGRPFVGKAGKVLDDMLAVAGLKREEVYITNVVKCRPIGENGRDRTPTDEEVAACSLHIKQQLLIINPKLVIALGATALRYFFPGSYMQECHGRFIRQGNTVVFPTYHPAATFYKRELLDTIRRDFALLGEHIHR